MSGRLVKMVNDQLSKEGLQALTRKSGLNHATVLGVADESHTPRRRTAYKLALACGCSEEDALAIAYECASKAKESA